MSIAGINARSVVIQTVRATLIKKGFTEYVPQLMKQAQPLEPAMYPFQTQWNRKQKTEAKSTTLYFSTSPEGYLKQILGKGGSNCFAISHAFRNLEGEGALHSPEFIMAEWYQKSADWYQMMDQTQEVVTKVLKQGSKTDQKGSSQSWSKVSYRDLWQQYLHSDLETLLTDEKMTQYALDKGCAVKNATWEQLFYQLVFNFIEPHISKKPFFLIDFPSRISPLAKPQPASSQFSERFELIVNGVELANGNTENTNSEMVKTMMKQEQQARATGGHTPPIDDEFITSLRTMNAHQWAGVGLGIDRLAMMISNSNSVNDVQWP